MPVATVPKRLSIRTACKLLGCANDYQLSQRLGARQGTIWYWKKQGGLVPALWRDRAELILLKESMRTHRVYPSGEQIVTVTP